MVSEARTLAIAYAADIARARIEAGWPMSAHNILLDAEILLKFLETDDDDYEARQPEHAPAPMVSISERLLENALDKVVDIPSLKSLSVEQIRELVVGVLGALAIADQEIGAGLFR